jgi:hypothetical protein
MGTIADKVATMRGCSLAEIVAEIARMEDAALFVDMDGFDDFWQMWPHKVGKPDAKKAYAAAIKRGNTHRVIMEGVVHYIHDKPPDRPWLNPGTFLRQERFNDQPAPVAAKPSKTSELRNDLRNRIGERSEDPRSVRQLPQRQPIA